MLANVLFSLALSAAPTGPVETLNALAAELGSGRTQALISHLHMDEIVEQILGPHRHRFTPAQRAQATEGIRQYAALTLRARRHELTPFSHQCREQRIRRGRARVACEVQRGQDQITLTVLLRQVNGAWLIVDVHTPSLRLLTDNGRAADRIIRREGIDGYLARLDQLIHATRTQSTTTALGAQP